MYLLRIMQYFFCGSTLYTETRPELIAGQLVGLSVEVAILCPTHALIVFVT